MFGSGSYYVSGKDPIVYSRLKAGTTPPKFTSNENKENSVSVQHREYIGDVLGSQDFRIQEFALNPGAVGTFPWLSKLAVNFKCYCFKRTNIRI